MKYIFSNKVQPLKPSAIREMFKVLSQPGMIALSAGNPSKESFPVDAFAKLSAEIFQNEADVALQYGITEGYMPLREKIAARLKEKFAIGREFDSVTVTSGGQQGLELACKVLCNEGDTVLCECPSFIGALNAFRSYGVKLVGVDMDNEGLVPESLEKAIAANENVKVLYTIPTFQNPMGVTMNAERRERVYDICKRNGIVIIEDNPYGELRFDGDDVPTIKSMDTDGIVIYCGSFSKTISSGMRVGFVCAHEDISQKMVVCKQVSDVHTNLFFQMLINKFLERYDFDAHIEGIRALYRRKCNLMLSEMDKSFPEGVSYTRPQGGLFIWCTLPKYVDVEAFCKRCLENKVAVVTGKTFLPDTSAVTHSFRINYSTPTDENIVEGIARLAKTLKEFVK